MDEITIRPLARLDEYTAAEQVQQESWQMAPIEAVPLNMLVTVQSEAGLVLGAFTPEGRLVGFALGFLGRDADGLKHCSHMAAVLPEYRNQRIAYRLKLAQRAWALDQGLQRITWTYDPLQYPNARLNIAMLGAISRTYKRNVYGTMRDELNGPLPTDRLYMRWDLRSPRVETCVRTGAPVTTPIAEALLTEVRVVDGVPHLAATHALPDFDLLAIQIPRQVLAVRGASVETALAWRTGTAAAFEAAFAAGYTVVNITPDPAAPDLLGRYTLAREP